MYFDSAYDCQKTGFKACVKNGFSKGDLIRMHDLCNQSIKRGWIVVISNNDTQFVRNTFCKKRYKVESNSKKIY